MTSTEAMKKLGKMLYVHVRNGRIRKIVPEGFKQGYYAIADVEALLAGEALFSTYKPGDYRNHPSSTYGLATVDDMPALGELGARALGYALSPDETRIARLRKNPECYQVLRNQEGQIVGYVSILPLSNETVTRLIRDEIKTSDITANEILNFVPGQPLHIYILAMCVDPACTYAQKRTYGSRLLFGLMAFLFDLAQRGVEIESITSRSWTGDGVRLLRHMNIPQLRSPVPGKNLFSVRVPESGIPLLVRYSELLDQWKQEHGSTSKPKRTRKPKPTEEPPPQLPDQTLWSNL